MKTLLTILFISVISVKGQSILLKGPAIAWGDKITQTTTISSPSIRDFFYNGDTIVFWKDVTFPHYDTLPKFDTVKVRVMYEQGESVVPIIIRGYQVRQWLKWNPGSEIFHDAYSYKPGPDKWIDTDIFLFEDKTRIDNSRKWGSKQRSW